MTQEKIGRYNIISELGRGGMATVFRAIDPNFDREVAVKILPRTFLHDPQFRARFEREAKMVAALEHAAIVPVYDFGEEDGQPFIVMRLMSGGSLSDVLKEGKIPIEKAIRVIIQLGAGLEAAHQKGIIHRDLKPGNILFDQYGDAYLSDFGIARMTEGDGTLTGSRILGTPAYMSPEQIQGDKSIDGRSDIYAMGIMFYQMLAGNTPFQATTPAKVMMMHILEPIPNLLASLPTIPRGIEAWLTKTLAKDPSDRFASSTEMAQALEAAQRGQFTLPPTEDDTLKTMAAPAWQNNIPAQNQSVAAPSQVSHPGAIPPAQQNVPPPQMQSMQSQVPAEFLTPPPQPGKKQNRMGLILGIVAVLGIGAIAVLYFAYSGFQGEGPLALLAPWTATSPVDKLAEEPSKTDAPEPTATIENETDPVAVVEVASPTPEENVPTATAEPPTNTPEPTPTSTPDILTIGGADKIAFINGNDIWLINVDGSDLEQLTNDGAVKTNLGWTPDGLAVTYISGKCIWSVEVESTRLDHIACFETAEYLDGFSISPDGSQVLISVNRELYVVPYDVPTLQQVRFNSDLKEMSECESLAPMLTTNNTAVPVKYVRWANDNQHIVLIKLANDAGRLVDAIQIFEIQSCAYDLIRTDEIPAARFTLDNYDKTPYIQNFGFDGEFLIALVSYVRNDGFGNLYIYNTNLHKAEIKLNPISNSCCYRDVQFSPDGRYLSFIYQPFEAGATSQMYYIPYATVGTGALYDPIELPEFFFEDSRSKPQPALRPAP
jgi:serine/threonine protein kinase